METPDVQFIVYFKDGKPDTAWEYHHKPKGEDVYNIKGEKTGTCQPYGRLHGYWTENKEEGVDRHFVENNSTQRKLMPFDVFMERVPPNKDCTKVYDSESDFLLDLL